MFTTGSKLLIGATVLSVVASVVYGASVGGPTGILGVVGLITTAVVFAFLAGVNYFNHDGNVPAMQQGVEHTSAAAQPPVHSSMWPLVAAVGAVGIAIGAVSRPVVFKVAVVVLIAAATEWMVQGWSERASADPAYNAGIRKRILQPLEFPLLATVGLGAMIYAFSRIMLYVSEDAARWVFILVGALVLGGGFLIARRRGVAKATIAGVGALGAVALLGVGVVSAIQGQRTIEPHPSLSREVCLEEAPEEEIEHADEKASQSVAAKSNVIANVYLQSNGIIVAYVNGVPDDPSSRIVVPRSANFAILFHNDFDGEHRLTARLGTFGDQPETVECTARLEEGGSAFLALNIPKTQAASSSPFVLMVPGLAGQEIKLVVP